MVKNVTNHNFFFSTFLFKEKKVANHHVESSIRNARSLGVIPKAKIKTVKMTLVIVIGKFNRKSIDYMNLYVFLNNQQIKILLNFCLLVYMYN